MKASPPAAMMGLGIRAFVDPHSSPLGANAFLKMMIIWSFPLEVAIFMANGDHQPIPQHQVVITDAVTLSVAQCTGL